jgi:HK97 family phage prohead protease
MKGNEIIRRDEWGQWVREHRPKTSGESPPLRKHFPVTVERGVVNPETGMRQFTFIASTEAVDREGDVIYADGWDLESFAKNPVILYGHDYRSFPIGRAVGTEVVGGQLKVAVEFTPADVNPAGYQAYKLVDAGFLNAVSVGFRPLKYIWNDEHNGYDFQGQELLEISVVPVPANQEALLAAGLKSSGAIDALLSDLDPLKTIETIHCIRALNSGLTQGGVTQHATTPAAMYCSTGLPSNDASVVTITASSGETWTGTIWTDGTHTTPYPSAVELHLPECWTYVQPEPTEEDAMDEKTAKDLVSAIRALKEIVEALTVKVNALSVEKEPDPDDDEMTEENIKDLIREVVSEVQTATTGKLPG